MDTLTFRQKDQMIKNIFKAYKKDKIKLSCIALNSYYPSGYLVKDSHSQYHPNGVEQHYARVLDEKSALEEKIHSFEYVLARLDKEIVQFIEHEYLNNDRSWWLEYYSKSTYYRYKAKVMDTILYYLSYN